MYLRIIHDRPTSWPAPSGMISTKLRCISGPPSALRLAMLLSLYQGANQEVGLGAHVGKQVNTGSTRYQASGCRRTLFTLSVTRVTWSAHC